MKNKITKLVLGDVANISISRFDCSEDRLLKIVDLFEYETVIIEIGEVEINSPLFQSIKEFSIKLKAPCDNDLLYTDVVFMVKGCDLVKLIHNIFISDCGSFSLEKVGDQNNWDDYICDRYNRQKLISCGTIKLSMVVVMNESQIDIIYRKDTYDTKQVVLKLKEIL